VNINLDGGDAQDDEPVAGPTTAPWDDNQGAAPERSAAGPVFTPQPEAAPAGGTADSIRARLTAAKAKQG